MERQIMKKILYFIIIIGIVAIFSFPLMLLHEESNPSITKISEKKENIIIEKATDFKENEVELINKIVEKKEIELVNKIVEKNESMILDFLKNHPQELKWFDISFFDFTGDGKREMVLSKEYLDMGVGLPSYNYVYDQNGNELFEFFSGSISDMEIYTENNMDSFYMCSNIHWGSHNDVYLHSKITKREGWEVDFLIAEWDLRREESPERYYILDISMEEKQELWTNLHEKLLKAQDINEEQFKEYFPDNEDLEKKELNIKGNIYYGENGVVLEIGDNQMIILD